MVNIIHNFCGDCGQLLPQGLGLKEADEVICPNCHADVRKLSARIEGEFTEGEGQRLYAIFHHNKVNIYHG